MLKIAAGLFLFFLILFPLYAYISIHLQKTKKVVRKTPPGPPGLPLIGNLHQFGSAKVPHEFLKKLSNKYGPLMSLKFGCVPVVVISSAKIAKEALKTHDLTFSARPLLSGPKKLSYGGLDIAFTSKDSYKQWRELRKISVLHFFSPQKVQSFRPVVDDEVSIMMKEISDLASSSQVINISQMAFNLTSRFTCRIAFGKKFDQEEDESSRRFDQLIHECEAMFVGQFVSDFLPLFGWIDKLSGMSNRLEKIFKDSDLFYQELLDERLNLMRSDKLEANNFLDLLIQMKDDQSSSITLSWDHIKAVMMDIFVAGSDTTSTLLIWVMTALMKAPTAMKRVQIEIRDFVKKNGTIGGGAGIQELPYFNAVIKETLRLYPPATTVPRETIADCNVGGYDIKANTMIIFNLWAIARDPETWEYPENYIPERFLNSCIDVKGNDFELIPFGAGRKGCPGISLALSTVKVAVANLLYAFDWELPSGTKIEDLDTDMLQGLVMQKKNPLCLVAKNYAQIL